VPSSFASSASRDLSAFLFTIGFSLTHDLRWLMLAGSSEYLPHSGNPKRLRSVIFLRDFLRPVKVHNRASHAPPEPGRNRLLFADVFLFCALSPYARIS
jgi:hypothetical protein